MNEQNPELLRIIGTPPKGLIISGCLWFFFCVSIIGGMYFIKYSQFINIPLVYIGNQNSNDKDQLFFTVRENDVEISLLNKGSKIYIQCNNTKLIKGIITNIFITDGNKIIVIKSFNSNMQELLIRSEKKARIAILEKRMIELIPFFNN